MTLVNHALTGATIGLLLGGEPLLALPLAIISHFICDALPHAGSSLPDEIFLKTKFFRSYLIIDSTLCVLITIILLLAKPDHWFLAAICAFAATTPDALWLNQFLKTKRNLTWRPNWYENFAKKIQWFQRPIGAVVEVVWFAAAIAILIPLLRV